MGDFFGRLGPDKKIFFDFFLVPTSAPILGPPPLCTLFWTPFGTRFGPVLDTLDHFGPFWAHFGPFWSLWVTIEAIHRSQMASRASNESENVQKSAQNGSKMAQTWPHRAILGHFGRFGGFFRPFGALRRHFRPICCRRDQPRA